MRERIKGAGPAVARLVAIIQRAGAKHVEFGYLPDDPAIEPSPGDAVTWWAKVTWAPGEVETSECRTSDHKRGPVEALAMIIRRHGGRVEIS